MLPQNLAALGLSPPVPELEGCFGGASIDGVVVPRRSQAARETSAICIFQAAGTCGPHRSVDLVSGSTLDAKRYNGRSNLRMINQSNFGGVSPRAVTSSDIVTPPSICLRFSGAVVLNGSGFCGLIWPVVTPFEAVTYTIVSGVS